MFQKARRGGGGGGSNPEAVARVIALIPGSSQNVPQIKINLHRRQRGAIVPSEEWTWVRDLSRGVPVRQIR